MPEPEVPDVEPLNAYVAVVNFDRAVCIRLEDGKLYRIELAYPFEHYQVT